MPATFRRERCFEEPPAGGDHGEPRTRQCNPGRFPQEPRIQPGVLPLIADEHAERKVGGQRGETPRREWKPAGIGPEQADRVGAAAGARVFAGASKRPGIVIDADCQRRGCQGEPLDQERTRAAPEVEEAVAWRWTGQLDHGVGDARVERAGQVADPPGPRGERTRTGAHEEIPAGARIERTADDELKIGRARGAGQAKLVSQRILQALES